MSSDDVTSTAAIWSSFAHDPRAKAHAGLRAADADRDLVARVLSSAYADGRLDREEHDERADVAARVRTLGEVPPLICDLVPDTAPRKALDPIAGASRVELLDQADEAWRDRRRHALFGFIAPTLICWSIYLTINDFSLESFPWPLIVMAATGVHLLRTVTSGHEIRREELRRLEKQQAKALRKRSWRP